jgi:hypothetical protein
MSVELVGFALLWLLMSVFAIVMAPPEKRVTFLAYILIVGWTTAYIVITQ